MESKSTRQGVKVRTVFSKRLHDNRTIHMVMVGLSLPFTVLLFSLAPVAAWFSSINGILIFGSWAGYVIWFLTVRLFCYSILAVDGFYFVRYGYAVRITWDMIDHVETVVGYRYHTFVLHFKHGLIDEATQTPFVLAEERVVSYHFSQRALTIFKAHVPVTVNS